MKKEDKLEEVGTEIAVDKNPLEVAADQLINMMPEVSENAPMPESINTGDNAPERKIDANTGTEKRGRGRPKGAGTKSRIAGQSQQQEETVVSVHAEVAGVTAGLFFTLGTMMGGSEWLPDNDEKIAVTGAFEQYFKSTGRTDLPPVIGLIAVLGFYGAKRFGMPETQKRAIGVVQRVKIWWANRKLKKHNLRAVEDKLDA